MADFICKLSQFRTNTIFGKVYRLGNVSHHVYIAEKILRYVYSFLDLNFIKVYKIVNSLT
ncbi:hypothetical protein Hanom_Chr17g01576601 [Helianthus anomalus]